MNNPLSMNRWNYVEGNPVNHIDPTGHITEDQLIKADNISKRLASKGIIIYEDWGFMSFPARGSLPRRVSAGVGCTWQIGRWDINDLINIDEAMKDLEKALGGSGKIRAAVGQVLINKKLPNGRMMSPPNVLNHVLSGDIIVQMTASSSDHADFKWSIVHEFGHVWDYRNGRQFSSELMTLTGGSFCWNADPTGMLSSCILVTSTLNELPPDYIQDCIEHPEKEIC